MTTEPPILGVILAGGLSRRMGGTEKSLIRLAGKPLIAHVRDRLAAQVDELVVSANGEAGRFAFLGLAVVPDTVPGHAGPLAGILAGMRRAEASRPAPRFIATAATDTPFLPANLVARLADAAGGGDRIALARSDGKRHPVFGLWPVALADDLERFLNSGEGGKVMRFASRHRIVDVDFALREAGGMTIDPFFNINTPEDLALASRLAGQVAT
ncbi:MAG: molybdenum cofactor guanylyltransferase [Alphaproteobacteria bacterium]|nr:MAG: molybdenum cofactor guanylyltransferase [Alphaproteobacteria bacterium]